MMARKGQVSVYIVVACLVIILAVIYTLPESDSPTQIMETPIPSQTQEFQDGRVFLQTCLDDASRIAVGDFAESGRPGSNRYLMAGEIPRAVFTSSDEVPSLAQSIETLKISFETQLDNCLMDQAFSYELAAEDSQVDVAYMNGKIQFRTYPVIAKSGQISKTYDPFINQVAYPLDGYLRDAKSAMDAILLNPGNINMSAFLHMNSYHTINQVDAETFDITLSADQWSGTSYSFIAQVRQ